MFETSLSKFWESAFGKDGGHYNIFRLRKDADGIEALRSFFEDGKCNELNFVLFSTSGVHGSYATLDEIEADTEDESPQLTFVIVQPRLVTLRYGNIDVRLEDIPWLRNLAESTPDAVAQILKGNLPDRLVARKGMR